MISDYDVLIQEAVELHLPDGYDWRMFKAQMWQESRLRPEAVSPIGAAGIAQFIAPTWSEWSVKAGFGGYSRSDPRASIYTAALYMNWLIEEWSWPRPVIDRYCLAMASYNAGLGHLLDAQKNEGNPNLYKDIIAGLIEITGPGNAPETIGYVEKILAFCSDQITGVR